MWRKMNEYEINNMIENRIKNRKKIKGDKILLLVFIDLCLSILSTMLVRCQGRFNKVYKPQELNLYIDSFLIFIVILLPVSLILYIVIILQYKRMDNDKKWKKEMDNLDKNNKRLCTKCNRIYTNTEVCTYCNQTTVNSWNMKWQQ